MVNSPLELSPDVLSSTMDSLEFLNVEEKMKVPHRSARCHPVTIPTRFDRKKRNKTEDFDGSEEILRKLSTFLQKSRYFLEK